MRRITSVIAAVALAGLIGGGTGPAQAANQLQLTRSTISVYDDIEVRFPGCSAQARNSQAASAFWDAGVTALHPGGDYGYDTTADDETAALESSKQPFALTSGPGQYTISGECVTVESPDPDAYGSAQLTVTHSNYLPASEHNWAMVPGQNVLSSNPDGTGFRLIAQSDGNLVQYSPTNVPVWTTATSGSDLSPPTMTADGNFVIKRGEQIVWQTNTGGNPGARLYVQTDGNLAIYSADGRPLWWTWDGSSLPAEQTMAVGMVLGSPNGRFRLMPQGDGNLVLYGPRGALWSTATRGSNARLSVQGDGNVVLYNSDNRPLWYSGQHPGAARLIVQNDGNVVLYTAAMRPLWWTGTRE